MRARQACGIPGRLARDGEEVVGLTPLQAGPDGKVHTGSKAGKREGERLLGSDAGAG